ncbi:MAG: nitroreductase family protein [Termitinemataceae bacterium]
MNKVIETILSRCSIRQFTGDTIPEEDIELILRAGMAAPSAVNVQPWNFILITDRTILEKLQRELPYAKMLDKAACAIIVCGIPDKDETFAKIFWIQDCSAATENILLAAHALGYGAVWTAVYPESDRMEIVRKACEIPQTVIPLNVIPIGIPSPGASKVRDKFSMNNIHRNHW